MRLKRIVAREWIIFLLIFFLSPVPVFTYLWIRAPAKVYTEWFDSQLYAPEKAGEEFNRRPAKRLSSPTAEEIDRLLEEAGRRLRSATKKKRPFLNYLTISLKDLFNYINVIIFSYPLFLFIRSIVWSIRTLKRRES